MHDIQLMHNNEWSTTLQLHIFLTIFTVDTIIPYTMFLLLCAAAG